MNIEYEKKLKTLILLVFVFLLIGLGGFIFVFSLKKQLSPISLEKTEQILIKEPYKIGRLKMDPLLEKASNDKYFYSLVFLTDIGEGELESKEFLLSNDKRKVIVCNELPKIGETVWVQESDFFCGEKLEKCHKVEIWGKAE